MNDELECSNCESLADEVEELESEIEDLESQISELEWDLGEATNVQNLEKDVLEDYKLQLSFVESALQDLGYIGSATILGPAHFINNYLMRKDQCITSTGAQPLENNVKRSMEYVKSAGSKFMTLLQRLKK